MVILRSAAHLSGSANTTIFVRMMSVWDAAIDTLKPYSITTQNKDKGVIETAWIEMEGKERTFGAFGREGFGNRERARLTRR